jgi:hypothetical protein
VPFGQNLPEGFTYPDLGATDPKSVAVLNPGKARPFTFPFDPNETAQVRKRETALFLYGHIDYIDAFGKPRSSQFSYQYFPIFGEDGQDKGHSLVLQQDHNDAN